MKRVLLGFVAGFLATIVFHQLAVSALHAAGIAPRPAWNMTSVPPFGVPSVISLSFWGGIWGAIMIPVIDRRRGGAYYAVALVFGAILPTLVAWFVSAPLHHQPIAGGWKPRSLIIGPIVNGVWGVATALFYALFTKRRM